MLQPLLSTGSSWTALEVLRSPAHPSACFNSTALPASTPPIYFYYLRFLRKKAKPTHFSSKLFQMCGIYRLSWKWRVLQHTFLSLWSLVRRAMFWNITWSIFLSLSYIFSSPTTCQPLRLRKLRLNAPDKGRVDKNLELKKKKKALLSFRFQSTCAMSCRHIHSIL